jgi:nicotinamidase-related amidase
MPGSRPVLLLMDFQHGIVERVADSAAVPAAGRAVKAARATGIPVMFVRVLTEKVFSRQALVTTVDEWIATL